MTEGIVRQLASTEIYRNRWLRVREDDVEFADGERGTYTVVDKRDFVLVLPRDGDGFWMVEQYRYPVSSRQWEFPQGGWPAGRSGTQEELARAELREETGFAPGALTHLGRLFTSYGFCSQSYDVFLATGLVPGEPDRESTEADMVHAWRSEDEIRAMIRDGRLADAHTVAALGLYDNNRPGRTPR